MIKIQLTSLLPMKGVSDNSASKKGHNNGNKKLLKKPIQVLQLNKKEASQKANESKSPKSDKSKEVQNNDLSGNLKGLMNSDKMLTVSESEETSADKLNDFDENSDFKTLVKPKNIDSDTKNLLFERTVDDFDFD